MVYYSVESIGKGRQRGKMKTFDTRAEADSYARSEYAKDRAISIGKYTHGGNSMHTVAQRGMEKTALYKGKYTKGMDKSYGKIGTGRKKSPYGIDFNFKMPKIKFGF